MNMITEKPIAAKISKVGSSSLNERIANLELSIIGHPCHALALKALTEEFERNQIAKNGKRLKSQARLFYGNSGAGKTTVIEDFCDRHPDRQTPDGLVREVIVVETPSGATKKSLADAILIRLGYKPSSRHNADQTIQQISDIVKNLGTKVIILDEAHHILPKGVLLGKEFTTSFERTLNITAEYVKSLLNQIKCQIALFGLPVLEHLDDEPQLYRRVRPNVALQAYDWTAPEQRIEFIALLANFEKLLGLPLPSNLFDQDFAMRFNLVSGGSVGLVSKYLSRALELATARNLGSITPRLMAEVYASWHSQSPRPKKIAFTAKMDIKKGTSLEKLHKKFGQVRVDKKSNPFLCSDSKLDEIWNALQENPDETVKANTRKLKGIQRQVRGTGLDEPKPFKR